ncbi:MAG TPA: substrate-binding domain-containing protein [Casimicrobiaceae bacterium]|nr:substrate-binding domain-containing protein [Casimicrobiaceae bacterium]
MTKLRLLSAGAAQGVVSALAAGFAARNGCELIATFQAVGALKERLAAGEHSDVLISTSAMVGEFARESRVLAETVAVLGRVETGIAVRESDPAPSIGTREALHASLAAAPAVYFPDPTRATAGIHFAKVLRALELDTALAQRLHPHPNGAAAMAALARAGAGSIGCTQVTEIRSTPGVRLVGVLPEPFALATAYAVAVCSATRHLSLARELARMLSGPESAELRSRCGFEP